VDKNSSVAFFAISVLTSCSHQKPISRDELASKLRSADSIAAETSTFIDYVMEGRTTQYYAKGHLDYLLPEVSDISKELRDALPPPGAEARLDNSRKQTQALAAALSKLSRNFDQPEELVREQAQIAAIRRELEQAISSL
jgi:hypothetical protein